MSLASYLSRHATLERWVLTDDLTGGQTGVWTSLAALPLHITSPKSSVALAYQREGFSNVVVAQTMDDLPKRILGFTTLSSLFRSETMQRLRFYVSGRTLQIIAFRTPCDGRIVTPIVNMDLTETVQKVGYFDVPTGA